MKEDDGTSKGFGFVCFMNTTDAMEANAIMKNLEVSKGMIVCEAKNK
jgi:RNA recognition motif-containing protein